jgi:hypothetical protein
MDYNFRLPNEPNIFFDEPCHKIATYLRERLNESVVRSNTLPAILDCANTEKPLPKDFIIVNGIRSYRERNIPTMEYPVLKVYRSSDLFKSNTTTRETSAVVTYSLLMPNNLILLPILQWISWEINYYLLDSYARIGVFTSEIGRRTEYITEAGPPSFEHLNFYFNMVN